MKPDQTTQGQPAAQDAPPLKREALPAARHSRAYKLLLFAPIYLLLLLSIRYALMSQDVTIVYDQTCDECVEPAPETTAPDPLAMLAPSGLYESYSPVLRRPVGPLTEVPVWLPRWLEVTTTGNISEIVFHARRATVSRPEDLHDRTEPPPNPAPTRVSTHMTWRLTYGAHGLLEKLTLIDGELWTRSAFTYDERGYLVSKLVTGPGIPSGRLAFTYETDDRRRVARRTAELAPRYPWEQNARREQWIVDWTGDQPTARTLIDDAEVRRDVYDAGGRLVQSELGKQSQQPRLSLFYQRDDAGTLIAIERGVNGALEAAAFDERNPAIGPSHLDELLTMATVEYHEVALLFGLPVWQREQGQGASRRTTEDYSDDCWLNLISALDYDAADVLMTGTESCICGG